MPTPPGWRPAGGPCIRRGDRKGLRPDSVPPVGGHPGADHLLITGDLVPTNVALLTTILLGSRTDKTNTSGLI